MTRDPELDRLLDRWMDTGPSIVADRVIAAAMTDVHTTRQRGGPWPPRRIHAMTTRTIDRSRAVVVPLLAAVLVLLAAGIGAYLVLRPDVGIGDTPSARTYTPADASAIAEALAGHAGLVTADVPASAEFMVSGSDAEALHLTMSTSPISHSGVPADEEARIGIMATLYAGLVAAETRFYDRLDGSGTATPVTTPGGASYAVIAATYTDAVAAAAAFAGFRDAYETWGFDATEPWAYGDESVAFAMSAMDRAHARCAHLGSTEPCATALRTWRDGNLVVTVIQQGSPDVGLDELVAAVENRGSDGVAPGDE